jgi:uncharacterized SAM-binding protein YcdF (DUF218 family)
MESPRRPLHRRRTVVLGVAALLVALWLASVGAVLTWGLQDDAQKADAIIVMGAAQYRGKPSPVLRARLDHAISLWQRGLAPIVVLTGGVGTGDTISEAAAGRVYAMAHAIPDSAILLENEGRSSSESLRSAIGILHDRRLTTAVVVSDPFHMLRLEVLGRRFGIDLYTSPALPTPGGRRLLRQWANLLAESFKAPLALIFDW